MTSFLAGIIGSKIDDLIQNSDQYLHRLCQTLGNLYQLCHSRLVAPFSFLTTLYVYNQTSSRSAIDAMSSCIPGGSYTTIQKWIKTMPFKTPLCPKGIIMNTFVTYKKGLKPGNTASSSVVTSKIYVTLDPSSSLQNNPKMKPKNWFKLNALDEYMTQMSSLGKYSPEKCEEIRQKYIRKVEEMRKYRQENMCMDLKKPTLSS